MSNPFDGVQKIVSESDSQMLRRVRDTFVIGHPRVDSTMQTYFRAFLSQLADRMDGYRLRCDQCGFVPTDEYSPEEGGQCPLHWSPNHGCDGILRLEYKQRKA